MNIVFWIVAGIAALVFLAAGSMKLIRPKSALQSAGMGWVENYSARGVKLIGLSEVLGAIGLLLPVLTGIAPILSPIAGLGLTIVMIGAVITHLRRKESFVAQIGLTVLALAAAILGFVVVLS